MKSLIQKIVLFFLLAPPTSQCFSWWDTGHIAVAEVAYKELTPEAKGSVDQIVKVFSQLHPEYKSFGDLANWPDRIEKEEGAFLYRDLHYVILPYDPEEILTEEKKRELDAFAQNQGVFLSIDQAKAVLKSKKSSVLSKCWALAYIAHIVGDLHQPLHCCTRYSSELPEGDMGGNLHCIKATEGIYVSNLHQLWDSGVGFFSVYSDDKEKDAENQSAFIRQFLRELPKEKPSTSAILDPERWCKESFEIAKEQAHSLAMGTSPDDKYVRDSQKIVKERLVLAGYRLSLVLNGIFGSEE